MNVLWFQAKCCPWQRRPDQPKFLQRARLADLGSVTIRKEGFMVVRISFSALLCLSGLGAAFATPARIIILRHGEKATAYKLCDIGHERTKALTTTYLGRGAVKSLFARS